MWFYILWFDIFFAPASLVWGCAAWLCLWVFLVLQFVCFLGWSVVFSLGLVVFGCICVRRSYNNVY